MNIVRGFTFLGTVFSLFLALAVQHPVEASESQTARGESVVGSLPYSNQWTYDRAKSFLCLSLNRAPMTGSTMTFGHFTSRFDSADLNFASIDYFTELFDLASVQGRSFLRRFSIWSRYSLGFGARDGSLSDDRIAIHSDSESATLLALIPHVDALLVYEPWSWLRPYAGAELGATLFRHSSSLSGAEEQGANAVWGPVAGVQFPAFFDGRGTVYTEARRNYPLSGDAELISTNTELTLGLGMVF